jgi:gliding motility-associated lipoprotein GldH
MGKQTLKYMKKVLIFFLLIAVASCDKSKAYEKFDKDFPENRWAKTDVRSYDFSIDDDSKNYNLVLAFTHIDDYQFAEIPLHIDIEKPDHSIVSKDISVKIKDEAGKQLGQCDGDYCDLYTDILVNEKMVKGMYKVKVTNKFQFEYVPNIIGLGIKLTTVQ